MRPLLLLSRRSLPSQVLLFGPAALLCLLGLAAARNSFARTVVRAEDSPDGATEAVVYLLYSPTYPFTGDVSAYLDLRRLPGHELLLTRALGSHRWCSEAMEAYRTIQWEGSDRIILRSADGNQSHLILNRFSGEPGERKG
jgi:hypothetical protein